LTSCSTEIIGDLNTTVPTESTTTTLATPTGDIEQLLEQLDTAIVGLGQKIVDADASAYKQTYAEALAILEVLKPQVESSGIIGLDADVQRIVELVRTATERKRPADADKAARFLSLLRESLPELLNR
jgi:prophage DNA circulation protein